MTGGKWEELCFSSERIAAWTAWPFLFWREDMIVLSILHQRRVSSIWTCLTFLLTFLKSCTSTTSLLPFPILKISVRSAGSISITLFVSTPSTTALYSWSYTCNDMNDQKTLTMAQIVKEMVKFRVFLSVAATMSVKSALGFCNTASQIFNSNRSGTYRQLLSKWKKIS